MRNFLIDIFTKYENSKLYKKRLIKQLKPLVSPGVKSQDELILSLKKYFDFVTVNTNEVDKIFWEISVLGNLYNKDSNILEFKVYKIINNNFRSNLLYEDEKEDIFVVFESTNDFFVSNSQIIQLVLLVELGVSELDYRMETPKLINYLRIYKEYKKVFKNQKCFLGN